MDFKCSDREQGEIKADSLKSEYMAKVGTRRSSWGGAVKNQQILRTDTSRNYGGFTNIADGMLSVANELQKELDSIILFAEKKRRERISKGMRDYTPNKILREISAKRRQIQQLKDEAQSIRGYSHKPAETKHVEPAKPVYVGKKESK